jgi:hypothetical protein
MATQVSTQPFQIGVPQPMLDDLQVRLQRTPANAGAREWRLGRRHGP